MSTAVLLIAHGSPVPAANADLHQVVAAVKARGSYEIVEPAFLEGATPSIPEGIDRCVELGADSVLIMPYFLLLGKHVVRDLPAFVEEARERHPDVQFVIGQHLSGHDLVTEIVLERVAASGFPLRGAGGGDLGYKSR